MSSLALPRHINLTIEHNPHAISYMTVEQYLAQGLGADFDDTELTPPDRGIAIKHNELWVITWYPDTPVGQCVVAAATLARALERACE